MDSNEQVINTFATRVRQMILSYKEMKRENSELYAMVDERDEKIKQLEAQLALVRNDYDALKMAKMLEVSDGDMENAKKKLARLIKDVDKCITLLSEK
jgi:predicted RNase H-like nuclease (RuvC/YqgF family)